METENAGLFQEFDEAGRSSESSGELVIRPAGVHDIDALGCISAEREGGDVAAHAASFETAIGDESAGSRSLILVAEADGEVIGFGKACHLSEVRGADSVESPEGWYLTGVVVAPRFRRRGVGFRLTAERLRWIAERDGVAYYFANARNRVSIALHQRLGFIEVARGPSFAGVPFAGGEGILFQADLAEIARRAT